ncbi:PEP-utilizing enzyme [Nocardia barduliensis]|uniref:PEP-utilizing enzyme n=1 Tax=Nocardia barduliensis TaxID=2736643 RepID=UPI001571D812|nr:PEP-utilizing enzyme [Nocardia barduliensis]
MRILVTGVSDPSGRAVARMMLAAGYEVVGLDRARHRYVDPRVEVITGDPADPALCAQAVAGCATVVHLGGSLAAIAAAARDAGARLVVPVVAGSDAVTVDAVLTSGAKALIVRTAPVAGRRIERGSRRILLPLLSSRRPGGFQLLHTDDFERFLVMAAGSPRTGSVELAAPGVVSGEDARRIRQALGNRASRWVSRTRPSAAQVDPTAAAREWDFRCGWTASEVAADIVRGLDGRRWDGDELVTRPGAIPLPGYLIPTRAATSDGHALVSVAPEGLEGEFDDRVDPAYPVHTATNTSEALPGPLTPLTVDLQAGAIRLANAAMGRMIALDGIALEHWTSRVTTVLGHHIYINASIGVLAAENMPGWDEQSIRRDVYGNIPAEISLTPHGKPPTPTGFASTRATWRAAGRVLRTALRYRETTDGINAAAHQESLGATAIRELTDEQLHARALLWRDRLNQSWAAASIGVMMTGAATAIHARGKNAAVVPIDPERLESARTMLAVERLAALCRADTALHHAAHAGDVPVARAVSPAFSTALDEELHRIGHRGPGECELRNPTFGDRPELLVVAAARAAEMPAPEREPVDAAASRTARMAAGATMARERVRDAVVRYTHCLRLAVRERADRLIRAGLLEQAEDACFLTLDEILWAPADLAERVARRRAELVRLQGVRMPDVIAGDWEPLPDAGALAPGESLAGTGVCPGIVEGTVKRVLSLDDDIEPGDILVASVTDTGHTAMFAYAAAVVTDIGGSASHAAIVAREFGIPCIVDTKTASTSLTDGQRVRVDGSAGTVTLLDA